VLVSGCTGRLFATGDELLAGLIICLFFRKNGRIVQRDGRDGNDARLLGNWNFNSGHRFRPLVCLSIVHQMKTDATTLVDAGRQSQQAPDQGLRKIVGLKQLAGEMGKVNTAPSPNSGSMGSRGELTTPKNGPAAGLPSCAAGTGTAGSRNLDSVICLILTMRKLKLQSRPVNGGRISCSVTVNLSAA
jgi:hypothetical protein